MKIKFFYMQKRMRYIIRTRQCVKRLITIMRNLNTHSVNIRKLYKGINHVINHARM